MHCNMVVLSGLPSLFCEDLNLWGFVGNNDSCKLMNVSCLNSRNYKNQTFYQVQKVLLLINLSPQKKAPEAVLTVEITVIKKKTVKCTQYQLPIFCQNFRIFCCKIEIVEKIKCWVTFCFWVWLKIKLVLRFMKSNKFYYAQSAKVVNFHPYFKF